MDDLITWLPAQLEGDWDPISQAHRAILNRHHMRKQTLAGYEQYEADAEVCAECTPDRPAIGPEEAKRFPCPTWSDVALAYQHNPGYREEWRS